ncbi:MULTISPECIES: FecR domain-containing protein [unclassified Brenneria]|uniref:FecR family protein n=1 Tax=unclassified Brenneria TaxID=2634434 RepID=UPI0029C5E5DF|nr:MULTISPECIES: FecR domain-containing protein [unclassified Brenneria]MDX5630599.1 FecR domain-containing protein [Brenneria sp. L3-3Z]MDX5697744.1 FecR domain-containing protein [Brenneria sp. L4-2C]
MDDSDHNAAQQRQIASKARAWIVRLSSGQISREELQRFYAWRELSPAHRRAFEHERTFWQQLSQIGDGDRMASPTAPLWSRRRFLWGSAAAAVVMAATPSLWQWSQQDFSTAAGQQARIRLPDGSDALLNTDSAIALDFSAERRRVRLLHGEALFQTAVSAASPFEVMALGGVIDSAAAAAFAVTALDEMATVRVTDGQVRVAAAADAVTLSARQQTHYRTAQAPAQATPFKLTELAWRERRVIFEGRPLAGALAELGRYLPEKVVLRARAAGAVPVSGVFAIDRALSAMTALARTQGLSVRRVPGLLLIIA